jgi:uncharacterized protein
MDSFYTDSQIKLQHEFSSSQLAAAEVAAIVHSELLEHERVFIESRDMLFLSTVDSRGQPTCSYKGGDPGFVRVIDSRTLVFPHYNGNGMFLSAGNMFEGAKVGILFIDFETPHRLRVHGSAAVVPPSDDLPRYEGAELLFKVSIESVFINCPRYVHKRHEAERSKYVPRQGVPTPFAQWKRIDAIQPALPPIDQGAARQNGGTITMDEYFAKLAKGDA